MNAVKLGRLDAELSPGRVVLRGRIDDASPLGELADQVAPGNVAIDFGVTGAPETFLVDAQGVIRYKYISPITPQVIATELLPRIAALKEATR